MSPVFATEPILKTEWISPSCHGNDDGQIILYVSNVNELTTLDVKLEAPNRSLNYVCYTDTVFHITRLKETKFSVRLSVDQHIVLQEEHKITEPSELKGGTIELEKAPSGPSACDGTLKVIPEGGTPPYTFAWSENANNETTARLQNVCMGIYRCEILDANHCGPVYISIPLFEGTIDKYSKSEN